jgi:CheY-like chemotaxis protein/two-component sensor histidine kinase
MSHELRTPLTSVLGWARLLRTTPLEGEDQARALETIERNARAQAQLIDDLLDLSRIVTGRLRLDVRPVELLSVIEAALEAVRPAIASKGLRVTATLDPTAGPVLGDAVRLQQIMWNILSNAIKFTPKAGVIEVTLGRAGSNVVITVRDTGQGIAPEFLPRVFDRFSQQGGPGPVGGLGLGLAIVRHLVELHGGTVKAESDGDQRGSTFQVTLPLRAPEQPLPEPNRETVRGSSPFPNLANLRVLVVEDNADAQLLVHTILERCGATVRTTTSAATALFALTADRPDIIVSDIGLPDEDGYALIRRIRLLAPEEGGHLPAIALTAYASPEDEARALSAGFQAHVSKPVEPSHLAAVVARLTGRSTAG